MGNTKKYILTVLYSLILKGITVIIFFSNILIGTSQVWLRQESYDDRVMMETFHEDSNYFITGKTQEDLGVATVEINLWFRADRGISCNTNNCSVTSWADQSENDNNAIHTIKTSNGINSEVVLLENALNFNPIIQGNYLNQAFATKNFFYGKTVVYMGRTSDQSEKGGFMGTDGHGNQGIKISNEVNSFSNQHLLDWSVTNNVTTDNGFFNRNGKNFPYEEPVEDVNIYHIGTVSRAVLGDNFYDQTFFIGGYKTDFYFTKPTFYGDIIIFTNIPSDDEIRRVESYLAIKYGITMDQTDEYDYVNTQGDIIWDSNADDGYNHDICGIGREDASGLDQRISKSTNEGTFLTVALDNDFSSANNDPTRLTLHDSDLQNFIVGNNGIGQNGSKTDDEIPLNYKVRLEREWMVQTKNFSQNLYFQFEGYNSTYQLFKDQDGDFSTGAVIVGNLNDDGAIRVSGIEFDSYPYFTLASLNSTLPIKLLSFNVLVQYGRSVQIDWETASERDNDYFTLERSMDGHTWDAVTNIKGAGNSSSLLSYSTEDTKPLIGLSYYRLKQTDYNGEYSYSWIVGVNVTGSENQGVTIHPNPAQDRISILGNPYELQSVKLFNSLGQEVTYSLKIELLENGAMQLNLSSLEKGIYLLKTTTATFTVIKQ